MHPSLVNASNKSLFFLPIEDLVRFKRNRVQFPYCLGHYHKLIGLIGFFEVGGV